MGIRQFRPVTPGTRFRSVSDFAEITKATPEKSLLEPIRKTGGRNNQGHVTMRYIGGGHKRMYRKIDWKRNKFGVPGKVASIEYDPNRTRPDRAGGLRRRREALHPAPQGAATWATRCCPARAWIRGSATRFRWARSRWARRCTAWSSRSARAAQLARSAGAAVQVVAKEGDYVTIRLRSTEMRRVHAKCMATIGEVGNAEHELLSVGKAGKTRWLGRQVAGSAAWPRTRWTTRWVAARARARAAVRR